MKGFNLTNKYGFQWIGVIKGNSSPENMDLLTHVKGFSADFPSTILGNGDQYVWMTNKNLSMHNAQLPSGLVFLGKERKQKPWIYSSFQEVSCKCSLKPIQ